MSYEKCYFCSFEDILKNQLIIGGDLESYIDIYLIYTHIHICVFVKLDFCNLIPTKIFLFYFYFILSFFWIIKPLSRTKVQPIQCQSENIHLLSSKSLSSKRIHYLRRKIKQRRKIKSISTLPGFQVQLSVFFPHSYNI